MSLYKDSKIIIDNAIREALPDSAVERTLKQINLQNKSVTLIAVGKAAFQMAKTALKFIDNLKRAVVITKYGHATQDLANAEVYEAGHPIVDENSIIATKHAIDAVSNLSEDDVVVFLVSGGGSALFESPLIPLEELAQINSQLLAKACDIVEINTIRKRLSQVKGGRFALLCKPAHVYSIVLSDIIGDPLDMIASGPAYEDSSTCEQALDIINRYNIQLKPETLQLIKKETPKHLDNVTTFISGSVSLLCESAKNTCLSLGYEPIVLSASMRCEARDLGSMLASIAEFKQNSTKSLAFIAGGEAVVTLTGKGKGGRNQEIALSAAQYIDKCTDTCVFSVGSDGTDGPTDAAGGIVDNTTKQNLLNKGIKIPDVLKQNDAYNALKAVDGLIITNPTGTNVNDLSVLLIKR